MEGAGMINRIRDIRKEKGLTLADVAARCDPPTTAQTIGRLETGMRNLSLVWMARRSASIPNCWCAASRPRSRSWSHDSAIQAPRR
jgi:DNA-binding XRE family transcriptional regulator